MRLNFDFLNGVWFVSLWLVWFFLLFVWIFVDYGWLLVVFFLLGSWFLICIRSLWKKGMLLFILDVDYNLYGVFILLKIFDWFVCVVFCFFDGRLVGGILLIIFLICLFYGIEYLWYWCCDYINGISGRIIYRYW